MRNLLLKLHLWVGLVAALPLIVVGITGALLVYGEKIDRARDLVAFAISLLVAGQVVSGFLIWWKKA